MRWTRAYIPTLKETPADAEIASHRLMLRAGLIEQVGAGLYTLLPCGLRVTQKVQQIVREELNRAGAHELLLPFTTPAELWRESGRWDVYGDELMRMQDRHGRDYCLGPTHEEAITTTVRHVVRSYKQLPVNLYQIQVKFRDEVRPRFGVMRGREFLMKDAYSFDRDEAGLDASYQAMYDAYTEIFRRCGLRFRPVLGDVGAIGGSMSHEFMVLAETGESRVLSCPDDACGYAATDETATGRRPIPDGAVAMDDLQEIATPGTTTVDAVTAFLGVGAERLIKTLLFTVGEDTIAALVPGDRELNEPKLRSVLGTEAVTMADAATVRAATGAPVGFAGPVKLDGVRVIADEAVRSMRNAVTGANKADTHFTGVNVERDFTVDQYADLVTAEPGDGCPQCGTPMDAFRGIEVGQVFKLGTKYSVPLNATFQDEDGSQKPFVMGCYGIGITRTVAAAIEQNHDDNGIIWPEPLAPYQVLITPTVMKNADVVAVAERLYDELTAAGVDVLYDDRDDRAGVKFNDGDLIGIPWRLTIGPRGLKEDAVELYCRRTGEVETVPAATAAAAVMAKLEAAA